MLQEIATHEFIVLLKPTLH